MSKVYVFLADGFEEIEGLTVVDILRRAGVEVITVSIMGRKEVCGSHQIMVIADALLEQVDVSDGDMLVLPGGLKGTENLEDCPVALDAVAKAAGEGRKVAAICAAPRILAFLGLLDGKEATVYPSMESFLKNAKIRREPAVVDGNIITGQGMGAAVPFALKLTEQLCGQQKACQIAKEIVYRS